jgi:quinolinate synthase
VESREEILKEIEELKVRRNAIILAHNYQVGEIQDIADFVGDSLELSRKAAATDAETIVFCGVLFMAETAAILSPEKNVLLPDLRAGCPLADMISPEALKMLKQDHPQAAVVCYVNSSAEVKAESDICCTSANAVKVVNSLTQEKVIFVPDRNLCHWAARSTDKELICWEGFCPTHEVLRKEDVLNVKRAHPEAKFVAHPECLEEVLDLADEVTSTSGILNFARETSAKELIIGTEIGMLHRLRKENPDKRFYPASEKMVCPNMKYHTLEKVRHSLKEMVHLIKVPEEIRARAYESIKKMLDLKVGSKD